MSIWSKKRRECGLTAADMANELGLEYSRYHAIEKGDINMPSNIINKFSEIVNRGKQNEITKIENSYKADEFWDECKRYDESGKRLIYKKMNEFNIHSVSHLTKLLGYKSPGTIFNYLNELYKPGDEFKKRIYNFFSDENNIQIPGDTHKKPRIASKRVQRVNKELDEYYENTDFNELCTKHRITRTEISNAIGVHNSTICNVFNKRRKPNYGIIEDTKKYLDGIIDGTHVENLANQEECILGSSVEQHIEVNDLVQDNNVDKSLDRHERKDDVVDRYKQELEEIERFIYEYEVKIRDAKIRQKICLEVLTAISEITNTEE